MHALDAARETAAPVPAGGQHLTVTLDGQAYALPIL